LLSTLIQRRRRKKAAGELYEAVVAQARQPVFYSGLGVPDTIDGRFDLIALHAILLVRRLKAGGDDARHVAREIVDTMFEDLDRSLRELGVSDQGLPRRMRAMAEGFLGRMVAYEEALGGDIAGLVGALRRNVYGTVEIDEQRIAKLTSYVGSQVAALDRQAEADLLAGKVAFRTPPQA
jgi:cytochrome b pre-mRNA-processing protein 3